MIHLREGLKIKVDELLGSTWTSLNRKVDEWNATEKLDGKRTRYNGRRMKTRNKMEVRHKTRLDEAKVIMEGELW